ncbi:MAG: stage III sporulation protein AE, partial [Clostridia bacterium]|nr:stage III sporulation protein AE [Clostridia bacterium]
IDRLDLSELQAFINSLDDYQRQVLDINDAKAMLRSLVNGESKDFFGNLINFLASTLGKYFAGFLPSFITIIVICLLKNMLGNLTSGFANGSTTEVVHIVCYCAVIIVLMTGVGSVISTVTDTVSLLTGFARAIFPVLLTLLSMLGGATTVATYTPLMAVLSGLIMKIITAVIVPAFIATIVFSVVGNISKNVKLDKLTKVIKSASTWLIGIVFGLFATFLTVQGITGGVVDKFGFNVAKFALSSYIPILGGYLSDGFDLLSTSLVLVKNAIGYCGALILICIVLFPLVKVVIFTLTLRLTSAIVEPIGDTRMSGMLNNVAGNMSLLITALAGVAFLFYILLMLFIGSCNMGL